MAAGVVIYTQNNYATTEAGAAGKVEGAYGTLFIAHPWEAPIHSITRGEDQGIPNTATEAFNSATATFLKVTVAQNAFSGAANQFADVYFADPAVRRTISVQAGRGESVTLWFEPETVTNMWYKSTNTSADMVIRWEYS